MSQELLYTSAEQGLKPGSRGFCTVLSTQGMSAQLTAALEGLSGYRPVYPPSDQRAELNPVVWSHLKLPVAGRSSHVLSRIADYGLDYSQRTNKLAHHVVLDSKELGESGPARLLAAPAFMRTDWNDEPRIVAAKATRTLPPVPPGVCQAWKNLTGDAGWAGVLAESFLRDPERPVFLIFKPGFDLLPLIVESISLLPPERRWEVTFSTYFTGLPQGVGCAWRCLLKDSPEVHQSLRYVKTLRIDLTNGPLEAASGGKLVQAARRADPRADGETSAEVGRPDGAGPRIKPSASSGRPPVFNSEHVGIGERSPDFVPAVAKKLKADGISNGDRPSQQSTGRKSTDVERVLATLLSQPKFVIGAIGGGFLVLVLGLVGLFAIGPSIINRLKRDPQQHATDDREETENTDQNDLTVEDEVDRGETPPEVSATTRKGSIDVAEIQKVPSKSPAGDSQTERPPLAESTGGPGGLKTTATTSKGSAGESVGAPVVAMPEKSESKRDAPQEAPPVKVEVVDLPKSRAVTTIVADTKSDDFSKIELMLWMPAESALGVSRMKSKYDIKELGGSAGLAEVVLKSTSNSKALEFRSLGGPEKLSRIAWCRLDVQPNAADQQRYQVFFHLFPIGNRDLNWQMAPAGESELDPAEVRWDLSIKATRNNLPELFSDDMTLQIGSEQFVFSSDVDEKAPHPVRLKRMSSSALSDYIKNTWPGIKGIDGKQISPRLEIETQVTGSESFGDSIVVLRLVLGPQLKRAFERKYAQLTFASKRLFQLPGMEEEETVPQPDQKTSKKGDPLSKKVDAHLERLKAQKANQLLQEKDASKSSDLGKLFDVAQGELQSFQSLVLKFEKFQADVKSAEVKSTRIYFKLLQAVDKKNSIDVDLIRYPEGQPSKQPLKP